MRSRLASVVVAAGLVLAACGGDGDTSGEAAVGELLDFEAVAVGDELVDVGQYAGTDLVIWFWAPW